jgi:purine-binding chemotaxis protein CheW
VRPGTSDPAGRLAELRQAFDRSFVERPRDEAARSEDLLAIRVGRDPYAVRVNATAGLIADRPVTPLPGSGPELSGVAGLRGSVVPVYDLATLLGLPGPPNAARWMILAAGSPLFALAFDRLDGHLRVPLDAIAEAAVGPDGPGTAAGTAHVSAIIRTPDGTRALIDLAAVRATVAARAAPSTASRKR